MQNYFKIFDISSGFSVFTKQHNEDLTKKYYVTSYSKFSFFLFGDLDLVEYLSYNVIVRHKGKDNILIENLNM